MRAFEAYAIRWIEDPLPADDWEGYRRLRDAIQTPIATGEREWTLAGYRRLIEQGIGDILLVDPGRVDGVTGFHQVSQMLALAHRHVNAHSWSSALNTAASVHLTAVAANYIVMELKPLPSPMQHELVREPIAQQAAGSPCPTSRAWASRSTKRSCASIACAEDNSMKITRIEVIPLVCRLEEAFVGGTYRIVNRNTLVTRVYTDDGIVGEAFGGDEDHTQRQIVDLIRDHFAPMLQGEDPRDVERLWEKMFHSNIDLGNRALHVLDLGNRSILTQAIAAVDNALWDALGKLYNVPLYKLLGGYRDRVPVIAIGGYYEGQAVGRDALAEEIDHYQEWQLAGIKFKVGRVSVAEDVQRVARGRELAGDDFIIACDANQAWTPQQAIEFCRAVEPLSIRLDRRARALV